MFRDKPTEYIKSLNKTIRRARDDACPLLSPKLAMDSLTAVGYSDTSFDGNHDLMSQLGHIILLMNDSSTAITVTFKSYRSRRVTGSVLADEAIAFSDLHDDKFAVCTLLEHELGRSTPLTVVLYT